MERLNDLVIDHFDSDPRELVLARGSISELEQADAIDYLLISSRSRDYDPAQGGWVAELQEAGVSVELLEREPAMDLRPAFPCWISRDIATGPGRNFKRLVVFEPVDPHVFAARDLWMVFQALRLFAGDGAGTEADVRVALPVLSSLAGQADFSVMLRMIFFAAASLASRARWRQITIIVSDERADQATADFSSLKQHYLSPPDEPEAIQALLASIKTRYPDRLKSVADAHEYGLTERQALAIYHYTRQSYIFINRALSRGDVTDPEFAYFQPLIEALGSGLAALANYSPGVIVSRNLVAFPGVEDIYKVSNVVREAAFTSTTRDELPVVQDYKILLKGQIGKDIEAMSNFPEEREVLFDSAMLHLVSKVEEEEWEPLPGVPITFKVVTTDEVLANTSNIHFSHL
ncbi:ADP-ribosyltransferase domain-containing protein [Pseudomonas sp. Pseusp122]|uniref:ADP-ribosyltransferase domain-containing protein n=1 Tax=unclassified Pseudomonas TaxID=196821 RepID=UPI0039A74058